MASWTFITNHGAVLALIGRFRQITARDISTELGITERSVLRIIKDLETEGYVQIEREGRANRYTINAKAPLRRQETRDVIVGELLDILAKEN